MYPFLWLKRDVHPGISHPEPQDKSGIRLSCRNWNECSIFSFFPPICLPIWIHVRLVSFSGFWSFGQPQLLFGMTWDRNKLYLSSEWELTWWIGHGAGRKEKLCSQDGLQDKWLYPSNCLLNLHRFILVQDAWEKENSVVKIHCSLMKTCFPCKTID